MIDDIKIYIYSQTPGLFQDVISYPPINKKIFNFYEITVVRKIIENKYNWNYLFN